MDTSANTQSYSDILRNIGEQLRSRQKLIQQRVLLITGPLIMTAVPLIYGAKLDLKGSAAALYFTTFFILTLLAFWWAIILGQIFKIERVIWIDSFFDKIPLQSKQSWNLARKLFWPAVLVDFIVLLRYRLAPVAAYLVVTLWYIWYWNKVGGNVFVFLGIVIGGLIALWVYFYFLNLRLRYIYFLLVDTYGTAEFSFFKLFKESKELNRTIKTGDFKKLLVTTIGADIVGDITNFTIDTVIRAVTRQMGVGGKMISGAAQMYTAEVVDINKKLAQTVTFYLYYRVARMARGNSVQSVNSSLYTDTNQTN